MGKRISKINDPAIQTKINELYEQKLSSRDISIELKKDGIDVSHMTIKRYIDAINTKAITVAKENPIVSKSIINIAETVQSCDKQLKQMLNSIQATKELKLKVISKMFEMVKMAYDMTEGVRTSGGNVIIKQAPGSQIQFVQDYKIYLKDLEERGDITIHNPMLKMGQQEISKQSQPKIVDVESEEIEESKEDDENGEN